MYLNTVFKYNVFKYCPALNLSIKVTVTAENLIKIPISRGTTNFHSSLVMWTTGYRLVQ